MPKTISEDILDWSINFVEKKSDKLDEWPICPYAKQARLKNQVEIIEVKDSEDYLFFLPNNLKDLKKNLRSIIQEGYIENFDLKIINEFDEKLLKKSGLLINKPKLYVCNVDEESINSGNKYTKDFITKFGEKNTLIISAEMENQINQLVEEHRLDAVKID